MNKKPYKKTITERPMHSGFVVLMIDDGETRGAWLRHENYGVMTFMFGLPHNQPGAQKSMTAAEFWEIVDKNLTDYIQEYVAEYMDV